MMDAAAAAATLSREAPRETLVRFTDTDVNAVVRHGKERSSVSFMVVVSACSERDRESGGEWRGQRTEDALRLRRRLPSLLHQTLEVDHKMNSWY
jgi:hypothetical protein